MLQLSHSPPYFNFIFLSLMCYTPTPRYVRKDAWGKLWQEEFLFLAGFDRDLSSGGQGFVQGNARGLHLSGFFAPSIVTFRLSQNSLLETLQDSGRKRPPKHAHSCGFSLSIYLYSASGSSFNHTQSLWLQQHLLHIGRFQLIIFFLEATFSHFSFEILVIPQPQFSGGLKKC